MFELKDIPKRKPRDYPDNKKWDWIGHEMGCHIFSKREWNHSIKTWVPRTERGRNMAYYYLRRKYPYAFL